MIFHAAREWSLDAVHCIAGHPVAYRVSGATLDSRGDGNESLKKVHSISLLTLLGVHNLGCTTGPGAGPACPALGVMSCRL